MNIKQIDDLVSQVIQATLKLPEPAAHRHAADRLNHWAVMADNASFNKDVKALRVAATEAQAWAGRVLAILDKP